MSEMIKTMTQEKAAATVGRAEIPDGTWPVMLTPFGEDGRVDESAVGPLVSWYVQRGAAGLFACCSSSEVETLSWAEKLRLTELTLAESAGRCAVVGSAMALEPGRDLAEAVGQVHGLGVSAVVLNLAELADDGEDDGVVRARLEGLLKATPGVPLGLYECPSPYHRLAGPGLLDWASETGRFVFFKDTCCDGGVLRERLDRLRGSAMRLFNAHTPLMREALGWGAAGFCGLGTNFYPERYDRLQASVAAGGDDEAAALQAQLDATDPLIHRRYPRSAKAYVRSQGVAIGTTCRRAVDELRPEDEAFLAQLGA